MPPGERGGRVIAACQDAAVRQQVERVLTPNVFAYECDTYMRVIRGDAPPADWTSSTDPVADAERLVVLAKARATLDTLVKAATHLHKDPTQDGIASANQMVLKALGSASAAASGKTTMEVLQGRDIVESVLGYATERAELRQIHNGAIGVQTGLKTFDAMTGGLEGGQVCILAGGPGQGKTTLATQIAEHATATGTPAVIASFENAPINLALKVVCAGGQPGSTLADVTRGHVKLDVFKKAVEQAAPALERMTIIGGNASLSVEDLVEQCRKAMERAETSRCLVVVDYLQTWASSSDELRDRGSDFERINVLTARLREVARTLGSPVLVLASQNRASGSYGGGSGQAQLDSLKGSGDIEYGADQVCILTRVPDDPDNVRRSVTLNLVKNRHGAMGSVDLTFDTVKGRLSEKNVLRPGI